MNLPHIAIVSIAFFSTSLYGDPSEPVSPPQFQTEFKQDSADPAPSMNFANQLSGKEFCFFCPPDGWTPADPKTLSPLVKIGFIQSKNLGFRSSVNLAEEEIDCTLDQYLEAVKKIHSSLKGNDWSYLGKIPTNAGEAALTQIDTKTAWGPVRMLQLVLVRDKKAYILTGATSKKEFPKLVKIFRESLTSLTITDDLLSVIKEEPKKMQLLNLWKSSLKDKSNPIAWDNFENDVLKNFSDLGPHWQALILAEGLKARQDPKETFCPKLESMTSNHQ